MAERAMDKYLRVQERAGRYGRGAWLGLSAFVCYSFARSNCCSSGIKRKFFRRALSAVGAGPQPANQYAELTYLRVWQTIVHIPYEQVHNGLRRVLRSPAIYCCYRSPRIGRQLQSSHSFAADGRSKLGAGAKRLSTARRFDSESGEHSFGRGEFRE